MRSPAFPQGQATALPTVALALTCTRSCDGGCPPAPGRVAVTPAQDWPGPTPLLHLLRRPADPCHRTARGRWAPCSVGGKAVSTRPPLSCHLHPHQTCTPSPRGTNPLPPSPTPVEGRWHSPGCHGGCCSGCPLSPPGSGREHRSPGCHPRSPPTAPPVDSKYLC